MFYHSAIILGHMKLKGGTIMEKRIIVLVIALLLPLSAISAQAAVELTYWTHEDPNRTNIENRYISEFEKANPGVVIKRVTNPSKKMAERILTAFAANQGPDIFNLQIEDEYAYIVNQRLAPVDYKAAGYDSVKSIYGAYIPKVLDPVWEDMVAVSEKIAIREGEIIQRRGFDFRYPYYLVSMVPMVEQFGGKLISNDGKQAIINDQAWIKFLTFMQAWGPNGKNLGSPTYKNARKLFNKDNNDMAMCMSGLYQAGRIRADNPDFYNSGEWRVIPYPKFKNAVNDSASAYYGHYLVVNAQKPKKNQSMAWKFIGYMLRHSEEYLSKVGLIQPTVKLMESGTFKAMPYSDVFKKDMERGHVVYYGENSAKIQQHVRGAVESVMLSGASPEEALKVLKRKAQETLEE